MNFKFKKLAIALALSAIATSANAAIDSNSGNSELVFSAWDSVAGVGYTYDLNWDKYLNDIVGIDQATTANATLLTNATVKSSMIGAKGVIFDGALTGLPFASASNVQWSLVAFDNVGRTRLLTTKNSLDTNPFASTNNQEKAAVTVFGAYASQSNSYADPLLLDTYAVTSDTNGAAYAGNAGVGLSNNIVDNTNALGGSSFLYMLAQSTQVSSSAQSLQTQVFSFDGTSIVARTYLDAGVWRLNVAAVPEADTSGMMLAGLGLMGFIARRRRNGAAK